MILPNKTDVIICGAGPVGLLTACLLGHYGIPCVIIEKNNQAYQMPRAIALDDETLRILQVVGLDKKFKEISKKVDGLQLCDTQGKSLFTLTKKAVSGKDASFLFHSPSLEKLLRERISDFKNVQLVEGAILLSYEKQSDNLELQIEFQANIHTLSTYYLLACDGANSHIRNIGNFGWQNFHYTATNLKIDVALDQPTIYTPYIKKYIGPRGKAYVFLDSWNTHKRIEFSLKNTLPTTVEHYLPKLKEILNTPNFQVIHKANYTFKSGLAKIWLKDNTALLGDAAHLMPPYIGQGMCSGFRDAHNLTSKLYLTKKLKYHTRILTHYQQERKSHTRFILLLTILTGLLYTSPLRFIISFSGKFLPQFFRLFEAPPIRLKKGFFGQSKLAGYLLPQFVVQNSQGETVLSDQLLGLGFTLIIFIEDGKDYNETHLKLQLLKSSLAALQIKVVFMFAKKPINPPQYTYCVDLTAFHAWFQKHGYKALLVRPDRYIFSACKLNIKSKDYKYNEIEKLLKNLIHAAK